MFCDRYLVAASVVIALVFATPAVRAQVAESHAGLPDDPSMAIVQSAPESSPPVQADPATSGVPAAQAPAGSSSSQTPAAAQDDKETQRQKAAEQLKIQEQQRVLGVMATFNTTTNRDALPLSPRQKFSLFFKSSTDPWPFLLAGVISGIGQADDSFPEYGQGAQGYAKRYGAAYGDAFIGNFWGNAVLPSLLHEDPRYFQKGTGSFSSRALWAAGSTLWCRRDNGSWGPNYANIAGNLIGAAISNVYYPASEHTVSDTITRGLTTSAEGIVGAEVIEFWPDIARRAQRKHAAKLAKQQAAKDAADAAAAGKSTPAP